MSGNRDHWGSRTAFVLAAAGSAVGLGNIWKFPYITYQNGGGKFVLVYLFCIAIVGLPLLIAEMMIGRATEKSPVAAIEDLSGKKSPWKSLGFLGVAAAFVILSFYSMVAGWVMHYIGLAAMNKFSGMPGEAFESTFMALYADPFLNVLYATIFMILTIGIVLGGLKGGIEKTTNLLMPTLFVIMFVILLWCMSLPGFSKALTFMFSGDNVLHGEAILEALGHSFFTLSLGMGAMLTYGSYIDSKIDLFKAGFWVAVLDTVIALVATVIIMSIMFTNDVDVKAGAGILFMSLPQELVKMTGGYFITLAFFVLVFFAALTSAISLLEVPTAYLIDKGWQRKKATLFMGISIWIFGLLSALSTSAWWGKTFAGWTMLDFLKGGTFFDKMDYLSSNWMLPIGGLMIALYVGFVMTSKMRDEQFHMGMDVESAPHFKPWEVFTRFIAPIIILLILAVKTGMIEQKKVDGFFDKILGNQPKVEKKSESGCTEARRGKSCSFGGRKEFELS